MIIFVSMIHIKRFLCNDKKYQILFKLDILLEFHHVYD